METAVLSRPDWLISMPASQFLECHHRPFAFLLGFGVLYYIGSISVFSSNCSVTLLEYNFLVIN